MKYFIILSKKYKKAMIAFLIIALALLSAVPGYNQVISLLPGDDVIRATLNNYFEQRGAALVSGDSSYIEDQFDTTNTYGKWSYEHELKRINYVKSWSKARGITFKKCEPTLKIFSLRTGKNSVRMYLSVRTKFVYVYNDKLDIENEFCLGTKHTISMINKNEVWYVTTDWYSDPLEDSGVAGASVPYEQPEIEAYAYARARYNRSKAVEYADRYCGALCTREDGYKYNSRYRNYADLGGDCANFASQVLADKSAGNLRMDGAWLYKRGSASKAWVNAGSFTKYLLYSGKARLVSRGKYNKVVNFTHNIGPGDIVSYEKKGDIVHVSIVTAKDSKGVPMVNSHTNDRYHVPWDLGWGDNSVNFWFVRIND